MRRKPSWNTPPASWRRPTPDYAILLRGAGAALAQAEAQLTRAKASEQAGHIAIQQAETAVLHAAQALEATLVRARGRLGAAAPSPAGKGHSPGSQ